MQSHLSCSGSGSHCGGSTELLVEVVISVVLVVVVLVVVVVVVVVVVGIVVLLLDDVKEELQKGFVKVFCRKSLFLLVYRIDIFLEP